MSHILSSRVEKLPGLSRGRRAVLEAVAWFIWESTGKTHRKTVRQIATRARYAMRATFGHLSALKTDGAIECEGKPGDPKGCLYSIKSEWLAMQEGGGYELPGNPCKPCAEPLQNVQGFGAEPLQNLHPKSPTEESHKEGTERESPPASPTARAPSPTPVFEFDSGEGKEAPDGWQPSPEVHQAAVEAGYSDPAEVRGPLYDLETRGGPPPRPHPIPANWQPNAADRAYAEQLWLDPDAPTMARKFVAIHQASGRKLRDWSARWRAWCLDESGYQRPQAATAPFKPPATEPPVIDGEVLSVDGEPPEMAAAVMPYAEACDDWTRAATPQELHTAMQRICELWPDSRKRPPDLELCDALANYAAPVLHCAINHVRNHVPYPTIKVADFVKAAQWVAQEAWARANPLPPTPERAPTPTATEREQARKQRRREELNAKLMAAADISGLFALVWPQGIGLKRVSDGHARALLQLAQRDLAAARSLAVECVAYWTEDGPAPDLTGLDTGAGDPAAIFAGLAP